ncbi:MAG: hypothetical protein LBR22_05585 [Desulfovibrio sp.]|jgi:hypothetical protein|nr:hypothetical protein [Desulfovibrio sp.]
MRHACVRLTRNGGVPYVRDAIAINTTPQQSEDRGERRGLLSRFADLFASSGLKAELRERIRGLPADSPGWGAPVDGLVPVVTYAHIAAMHGLLPEGFDQWDLKDSNGEIVANYAACAGHLPKGFRHWGLKNDRGLAVAHVAASERRLPEDFDQWEVRHGMGLSVAHMAADNGTLPLDVPERVWMLRTDGGYTVAHSAAMKGHLPDGFSMWDVADNDGWTVAHFAADGGHLPTDVPDEILRLRCAADGSPGTSVACTVLALEERETGRVDPRLLERARAIYEELLREQAANEEGGDGPEGDAPEARTPSKDPAPPRKSKKTSSSAGR